MEENIKKSAIVEVLPEKYTFPRIAEFPNRAQNANGLCWAYASLGCVEFKLVQEYPSFNPARINFSRVHMRYSCFDNSQGKEKSWGIKPNTAGGPKINQIRQCIEAYFSRDSGPIYEFMEPTPSDDKLKEKTFEQIEKEPVKTFFVSDFGVVDPKDSREERKNAVKRAVMNHGAVLASINYNVSYMKGDLYYVSPNRNVSNNDTGRHAVMIVGWDDTIKKSCFSNGDKLKEDGAFLIRDSSIKTFPSMNWNYWISYEDAYLLEVNCYVKSIEPWYDERKIYQNNYLGTYLSRNLAERYDTDSVSIKVNYKREADAGREVVRSVLLSNATAETNIDVFLVRSNGTEEALLTGVCPEDIGYGTYPVQTKDQSGGSKEIYLESGEQEFALKIVYSRDAAFEVPMEMDKNLRERMGGGIKEIPEKEQYLILENGEEDVAQKKFVYAIGRLGVKLITEPAGEEWKQLKTYVDAYTIDNAILSAPHNGKVDAPFSVVWEALDEKTGQKLSDIQIMQDTFINKASEDKDLVLHGEFSVSANGQTLHKINRYYYTRLAKAGLVLQPIQAPPEGEYQFNVSGQLPYPNTTVQIIGKESENQGGLNQDGKIIILGSGNSDDTGAFQVACRYMGVGKLFIQAKVEQMVSDSQTVEFKKAYTEEEEESGSGAKKKKYYPKNDVGLSQIFGLLVTGAAVYGGYQAYIYINQYNRVGRGMLPEDEIPLLNTHFIHLHADAVLGEEEEAGTIFFEDDVSGIRRIFKSMENSSIEGITFSMPRGMGLVGTMDQNSLIKDGRFIIREAGSGSYFAPVDKVCGGEIDGMQLLVTVSEEETESFSGLAAVCEGGSIGNCVCRLLPTQSEAVLQVQQDFSGILGEGTNVKLSGCVFEGSVKAGGNASGIAGNTTKALISSCYVNASLEGRSAAGITAFAMNALSVSCCMTEGGLTAVDSAGGVCAGFRPFEDAEKSCIQNCICRMNITIQEREKGMVGYAGGIVGVGGNQERGLEIENCLVLGTVSCGADSWIAGVAAGAKSCKNTVAASTRLSSPQTTAQISVFGDCVVSECLCYDEIEAEQGFHEGDGAVDGQVLARKKTYVDLGWDFEKVWDFSADGYPYLRSMSGRMNEWPFPFLRLLGLQEDGSMKFPANTQITFNGIYGKQMSGICFQSCTREGTKLQLPATDALQGASEAQKFVLNFGILSEPGAYRFVLQYCREERIHTVKVPVVIE